MAGTVAGGSWSFVKTLGTAWSFQKKETQNLFRTSSTYPSSRFSLFKEHLYSEKQVQLILPDLMNLSNFKRRFGTVWKLIRGLLTSFDAPGRCEKERLRKNLLGKFRKTEKKFRKKLQNKQTELGVSVWAIATFLKYLAFCKSVW